MYSRKNIRTTPSPLTTSLSRTEPRDSVTLPPDYTGIAFPTGDNSLRGIVRDYPETAILPSEDLVIDEEYNEPTDDPAPLPEKEDEIPAQEAVAPSSAEESQEAPPTPEKPAFSSAEEEAPPPKEPPEEPLISAELLRSLTLEDLMLLWMLLLLLCSEREDQIYLLLGLLLFTER